MFAKFCRLRSNHRRIRDTIVCEIQPSCLHQALVDVDRQRAAEEGRQAHGVVPVATVQLQQVHVLPAPQRLCDGAEPIEGVNTHACIRIAKGAHHLPVAQLVVAS